MDAGDGKGGERVHWTPFDSEVFDGEGTCDFFVDFCFVVLWFGRKNAREC